MRVLYIFPHPDDESFGPAPAIASQIRQGHEVFLLTYTRGGATRVRHNYGYSIEQMGKIRFEEMIEVAKVLNLTDMKVLDLPDSGLKELDPMEIENITEQHIRSVEPDVLVTYAVHGISGFHDHLVSHAIVKRVFCKLRREWEKAPKRLAFFTLAPTETEEGKFKLHISTESEIDCAIPVSDEDIQKATQALACYKTYQEVIRDAKVLERTGDTIFFEFFQENYDPHVDSIFRALQER